MVISIAEKAIALPLPFPVSNFRGSDEAFIDVLYCSLEFFKVNISNAEIEIGFAFPCPVTNFRGNDEAFIGVTYCFLEFFKAAITIAENVMSPTSLTMMRQLLVYSIALWNSLRLR